MNEDHIEDTEQITDSKPEGIRPEFPKVKTGIKAGPEVDITPGS